MPQPICSNHGKYKIILIMLSVWIMVMIVTTVTVETKGR
jgi:hypothetical protein